MAPKKVAMKKPKSIERPIEKTIMKSKKAKKKNYQSFTIYLYKILKSVAPKHMGISKKTMLIMNNFVNDMMEKIAVEAGKLVMHGKKSTMTSRDVQTAIKLLIPGELGLHANKEGMAAVHLYYKSQEKKDAPKP